MVKIDYAKAFFFLAGALVGCGAHEVLERLLTLA